MKLKGVYREALEKIDARKQAFALSTVIVLVEAGYAVVRPEGWRITAEGRAALAGP